MPLALVLAFVGYMLIYEAVHKESPWSEAVKAFGGQGKSLGSYDLGGGQPGPAPPPPGGGGGFGDGKNPSPMAAFYVKTMLAEFPQLRVIGLYSGCRCIDFCQPCPSGNCHYSQHAWANAVDMQPTFPVGSEDFIRYGSAAVNWAKQHIACIAHMIWQEPYHYNHFHADFDPQGIGTPPACGGQLQWGRPC